MLLPVGISFYTFQALGYSIDVFRGTVKAERNFITYALFVTFFPQLVAGPIERTERLLPQFKASHTFDYERVTDGLKLAAWGLFKKVCVADFIAVYVNGVYNNIADATGCALVLATIFFAVQILCDFSGYSDIAIGVAQVLGFNLMQNFQKPYFARSIADFWRRWHISLSSWFRDYLYVPLGGSRCSTFRRCINLFVTFVVSGLWHGASWHFVAWGFLHGIYQVVGVTTKNTRSKIRKKLKLENANGEIKLWWQCVQTITTFALVCVAWSFFRMNALRNAFVILQKILFIPHEVFSAVKNISIVGLSESIRNMMCFVDFADGSYFGFKRAVMAFVLIGMLLGIDFITRNESGVAIIKRQPLVVRWICYYTLLALLLWMWTNSSSGQTSEFIYFQF